MRSPLPNPGFYGWIVVAAAMACSALSSPGQSFLVSLYLEPLSSDLALSIVELSSLYSVATLAAATALPFVGRFADRTRSGRFMGGVLLLLGLTFAFMSTVRSALALGVAFFALRLLAQGAIGLGTITAAVRWFRRYRGRALALVSLGYAVGEMTFPSIVLALTSTLGWRRSWIALAAVYALVMAPLMFRLLRERDAAREPLDGESGAPHAAAHAPPAASPSAAAPPAGAPLAMAAPADDAEHTIELRTALRMPLFWGLLACVAVSPLVATGVIFHQVGLFASRGWSAALVAPAFMCYAAAGIVATYGTGLLVERVPSRFAITGALSLLAVALAAPWLPLPPLPAALTYGALLGLASGTMAAANGVIWPDYFGVAALGSIKGVVNAVRNGATAVGPPLVALLVAPGGSYAPAVTALAGLAVAGGAGALACRPPAAARR